MKPVMTSRRETRAIAGRARRGRVRPGRSDAEPVESGCFVEQERRAAIEERVDAVDVVALEDLLEDVEDEPLDTGNAYERRAISDTVSVAAAPLGMLVPQAAGEEGVERRAHLEALHAVADVELQPIGVRELERRLPADRRPRSCKDAQAFGDVAVADVAGNQTAACRPA